MRHNLLLLGQVALAALALWLTVPNANAAEKTAPPAPAPFADEAAMRARSVVSATDFSRLQNVFAKARRGEKVTVAVIGGSITAGAMASTPDKRYGDRIAQWWRETFPKSAIEFVNAGVGATTSQYAAARAARDLLGHNPDFVVVEFGVNDGNSREFAENYEGLLRQILKQPQNPAVLMLFMKQRGGNNAQEWQSRVGSYYRLPMISFRDAVQPDIDAGKITEDDVLADVVHPNDRGHEFTAHLVTDYLADALENTPADGKIAPPTPLAAPFLTDLFERARYYEGEKIKPLENKGWTFDVPSGTWLATQPGSAMSFEVEGEVIETMTFRLRGAMGRARVQIDDLPPVTVEGWFDQTWGGYIATETIARDLKPGKHLVKIEVLPDKAEGSTGYEVRLYGVATAGVAP